MPMDKQDFSRIYTMNDDKDPNCWKCRNFIFPIGCVVHEECEPDIREEDDE